jgi:hypothetical protein
VSSTRDPERSDDLSEAVDESRDEPFFVGEPSDYSEAFLAAPDLPRHGRAGSSGSFSAPWSRSGSMFGVILMLLYST